MYSNLTAMLASAQRNEFHRAAARHDQARRARTARRHFTAPSTSGSTSSRLSFRFAGRRSEARPAVAA